MAAIGTLMIMQTYFNWLRLQMAVIGGSLIKTNDGAAESAEQDQNASMCKLILLDTFPQNKSMIYERQYKG